MYAVANEVNLFGSIFNLKAVTRVEVRRTSSRRQGLLELTI